VTDPTSQNHDHPAPLTHPHDPGYHTAESVYWLPPQDNHQREVARRTAASVYVVHDAVRNEGEEELERPTTALAWSGLAAGLSMGLSLIGVGAMRAMLPEASWTPLVARMGYTLGFIAVILGRQQLFTENTLTVVLPLMQRRRLSTLLNVLRVWVVVLVSNLVGAIFVAWATAKTPAFPAEMREAFVTIGVIAAEPDFGVTLVRGIFAGWIIALLVWLRPSAEGNRLWVVFLLSYIVGLTHLSHVIAGTIEVMNAAFAGQVTWWECFAGYLVPSLLGNVIGGVTLTAAVNHAQVVAGSAKLERKRQRQRDAARRASSTVESSPDAD